jgi:hypothetical protein
MHVRRDKKTRVGAEPTYPVNVTMSLRDKGIPMSNKDILADLGAVGSGVTATWTWVAYVNDLLQLVATTIAIVAGIYAIRWHKVRITTAREKKEKSNGKDKS